MCQFADETEEEEESEDWEEEEEAEPKVRNQFYQFSFICIVFV